ncbi:exopolyphosphatase PRUNE1-like [Conger conger]|uniref:exopolyphosphatase PRUNE1-like n=1 Tax=Conger conger TaxID=82655 RepID=UPI002A5A9ECD|nr:exopolyphosphatase PRUNE1-like [Conger conger]
MSETGGDERSAEDHSGFHVVLGNEACDVDSMVSTLSFAYFLFKTSGSAGRTPVPVLNIPRADFPLRTDSVFLLRESGLAQQDLVFRDEVDLPRLHRAGRLALTLVDHNVLPSTDSDLEGAVVEVIDHHLQERVPSPSCPVTIETVGSCATLVAERIVQKAPEIVDGQVALLLYGSIILDCVNMAGKVTPKDSQFARLLESLCPALPPRTPLFQALHSAKLDISGTSSTSCIRGCLSGQCVHQTEVYVSAEFVKAINPNGLTVECQISALTRSSGIGEVGEFASLTEFTAGRPASTLTVPRRVTATGHVPTDHFCDLKTAFLLWTLCVWLQVSRALEQAQTPSLSLAPVSSPYADVRAYLQRNTLASRKKLLPLLKDFLRDRELREARRGGAGDGEDLQEEEEEEEECGGLVPPTPMHSLVEGCPLDNGVPRISAQALLEKFNKMAASAEGEGGRRPRGHSDPAPNTVQYHALFYNRSNSAPSEPPNGRALIATPPPVDPSPFLLNALQQPINRPIGGLGSTARPPLV